MGDTISYGPYGPYSSNPTLNLLIQAKRPQGMTGQPFNAAGVPGLPGSPSGPAVAAPQPFNWGSLASGWGALPGWLGLGTANAAPAATAPAAATPALTSYGGAAGIPGLAGGPSGAAVAPPGQPMPAPSQPSQRDRLADQATAYRHYTTAQRQGLTTAMLNNQSLAAAQAGRTYFNPALAGVYGGTPGSNVTNALMAPQNTAALQQLLAQRQQQ